MLIIFTNCYQRAAPYQTNHGSCRRRRLPIVTRILARGAKRDGGFGLVTPLFTNTYHSPDLGRNLPRGCFTNHYHRGLGQGIDRSVAGIVCQVAGYTAWHSVENRKSYQTERNGQVGVEKKKEKNLTMVA